MRQLELFPEKTFTKGDRVQFIEKGHFVPVPIGAEGTVLRMFCDGIVMVEFDDYHGGGIAGTFYCEIPQLRSL